MLSRINDFINPPHSKGDTVERPDQKNREKGGGQKNDTPAEEKQDDTFFSIEAIRALLKQENVTLGSDVIAYLDLLQQHSVTSIPIRNEQSIIAAITEAAARVKGK
jgi:hypothetical protein